MFSDRYRASDYQNSWRKNYHELSYAWSNEKNYHRLSWRIWTSSNWMIVDDSQWLCMIVGGQTEARAQLSSTIIDYHEPFDPGLRGVISRQTSIPFAQDLQGEMLTVFISRRWSLRRGQKQWQFTLIDWSVFNKLTSVFYASALLLIMNFVITLSK